MGSANSRNPSQSRSYRAVVLFSAGLGENLDAAIAELVILGRERIWLIRISRIDSFRRQSPPLNPFTTIAPPLGPAKGQQAPAGRLKVGRVIRKRL